MLIVYTDMLAIMRVSYGCILRESNFDLLGGTEFDMHCKCAFLKKLIPRITQYHYCL